MIRLIFVLVLLGNLCLFNSCQKEVSDDIPDNTDSTGVWVVTHKFVNSVDSIYANTPFTVKAGYFYDTVARTIIYNDTVHYAGDPTPNLHHTVNYYDEQGRLIKVAETGDQISPWQVDLTYNADGTLQKAQGQYVFTFSWAQQGTDLVGHSSDPANPGVPYSDGNVIFTLDADKRLKRLVSLSGDTAYGDEYEDVTRESEGGVIIRKIYTIKNGVQEIIDSVVYTREHGRPNRLSRFYELLGNGIAWYSNYYGISFIESPSYFSTYYEFEHSLCNKVVYFGTYMDINGQMQFGKYLDYDFVIEYDANGNPVKQTIYSDGQKSHEITYQWKKINWLN